MRQITTHARMSILLLILLLLVGVAVWRLGSLAMTHATEVDHTAKLKNDDGSWKFTNALIDETSPYLLQHAHNPVDWMPWGAQAFEKARREGKPIFLSIGYSTCYWCHVMERGVFENPAIAAVMNEHFICIKVDREERPDVDDIYMTATQIMTGSGGWPMSVFLTPPGAAGEDDPGLKPYFCGTYFPPEPSRGMPGFPQVLMAMHNAWVNQRKEVIQQADQIAGHVKQQLEHDRKEGTISGGASIQIATNQLLRSYDSKNGGFGQAPKFPTPNNLSFLLAVDQNNPQETIGQAIAHTLDRMARGGMFDQVGGGFHRYSTDAQWLVPHFEKMLYDNGQLLELYANAYAPGSSHAMQYARVMRETADYVLREMTDDTGAFWSAQDAEVNTFEGGNYVWTKQQVQDAIDDPALQAFALKLYGLDQGTNFQDPHHPEAAAVNVLFLPVAIRELGEQAAEKRAAINAILKRVRDQRDQPGTDDKVLTAWNGLMIGGLAAAGRVLEEPRYLEAAQKAAEAILKHMTADDGSLYRSMRAGEAKIPAFLSDYAFFVHGLIQLHRATDDGRYRELAEQYTDLAIERFAADGGGYYDTLADQGDLFVRTRNVYDGAIPSGGSQMVHNFIDLGQVDRAISDLNSYASELTRYGSGMAHMQHALLRAMKIPGAFDEDAAASKPSIVTVEVESVEGQANTYRVTLNIAAGYHLNANPASDEALIATRLEPGDVHYPKGVERTYPYADQSIRVYEGEVTLTITLDPAALPEALTLTYQACTDRECLLPTTVSVPLPSR